MRCTVSGKRSMIEVAAVQCSASFCQGTFCCVEKALGLLQSIGLHICC